MSSFFYSKFLNSKPLLFNVGLYIDLSQVDLLAETVVKKTVKGEETNLESSKLKSKFLIHTSDIFIYLLT